MIVPPLIGQYLSLTKNSSLGVAIAFPDLVSIGNTVLNQTGQAVEVIAIEMAAYLTLSLAISAVMNAYNARIARMGTALGAQRETRAHPKAQSANGALAHSAAQRAAVWLRTNLFNSPRQCARDPAGARPSGGCFRADLPMVRACDLPGGERANLP